ncbi:MAG: DUF4157 domain-containing protein [Sporocytophaga sp.]|uniref:pesticin C-terminus-like muramidase n=1 Tax=Sporocytophaga sp. TaxID=2231183 RepID=UPI001B141C35|nr:pesticin C-terminus-like muramidase [Sporocytophaga sp.]MBO9698558.1 DUF4157 domain-containing protein [Sporocytophaga sp.]
MREFLHRNRHDTKNQNNYQSQQQATVQSLVQREEAAPEEDISKESPSSEVLQRKWDGNEGGDDKNKRSGPVPSMAELEEEPVQRKGPVPLQFHPSEEEEPIQRRGPVPSMEEGDHEVAPIQRKGPIPLQFYATQTEEEPVQRRGPVLPMSVEHEASDEPGHEIASDKLPSKVQTKMENSFGEDFSDVSIHKNSSQSKDLNAHAYTHGTNIHFAPGQYNPESQKGQELIGHELTHVVQQRAGRVQPTVQKKGVGINDDEGLEKEAEEMGEKAARGESANVQNYAPDLIQKSDANKVEIQAGSIALEGEGGMSQIRNIHIPKGSTSSGVTIGKGYDMGSRTKEKIIDDLVAAGVSADQAEQISKAAGLKGNAASQFVSEKKQSIGKISEEAVLNLFNAEWFKMKATTKSFATSNRSSGGNARSREVKEGKSAGTYVLTSEEWEGLHPALTDLLTDMKYHGGYYAYDRIARINEAIKEHSGNQIDQLKAVREIFTSGYIEDYTESLGMTRGRNNSSETFYGQTVDYEGKFRRDEIRLAYLNYVISSLESGKAVEIKGSTTSPIRTSGSNSSSSPTVAVSFQAISTPSERRISSNGSISDSVGLGGRNIKADTIFVQQLLFKSGFNISINGLADGATINAIKDFQKIKIPRMVPDGMITPGKKTITLLEEFAKSQRVNPVKENKETSDSRVNVLEIAYENYKKGNITMVTLASKIKQCNYPNTVINIFSSLPYLDKDNLAFSVVNQCKDDELRRFDKKILYCLADALDTFFGTKNWSANIAQRNRVLKVLNSQTKEHKNITDEQVANPRALSNNIGEERVLKEGVNIRNIGMEMADESKYKRGAAYIDTEVNGHHYHSGEIIPNKNHTWCNQFAMDLALKVSNKDPFERLPKGKLGSTAADILDFMQKGNGFIKIPNLNNAWKDYINKGELVYFVDSGHIATGIPTSGAELKKQQDSANMEFKFGKVVQAGKTIGELYLNQAWGIDKFKNLSIYSYHG